jgi:gas vesicle protein
MDWITLLQLAQDATQQVTPLNQVSLLEQVLGPKLYLAVVGLVGSAAAFYAARTYKLRKLTAPQRRSDDKWKGEMEKKLTDEVEALKHSIQTVEGVARNASSRVDDVKEEVSEIRDTVEQVRNYLHETSHGLRNEMQRMTTTIGQELNGLQRAVGQVEGALKGLTKSLT